MMLVTGCASPLWTHLELGDILGVRRQRLVMCISGRQTLAGGVGWGLEVTVPARRAAFDVRSARFGVGTAARWTLRGEASDGASWPDELHIAHAVWHVEVQESHSAEHHRFDLPAGQRLVRSLPCDAASCSYVFTDPDAHRDLFTVEAVAGSDDELDAWLAGLGRGLEATVGLALHVEVLMLGGSPPRNVVAEVPLAPSGARVAFRP
jgi:hypothetical protein